MLMNDLVGAAGDPGWRERERGRAAGVNPDLAIVREAVERGRRDSELLDGRDFDAAWWDERLAALDRVEVTLAETEERASVAERERDEARDEVAEAVNLANVRGDAAVREAGRAPQIRRDFEGRLADAAVEVSRERDRAEAAEARLATVTAERDEYRRSLEGEQEAVRFLRGEVARARSEPDALTSAEARGAQLAEALRECHGWLANAPVMAPSQPWLDYIAALAVAPTGQGPRHHSSGHPKHHCITCGTDDAPGKGCGNCRGTGFHQSPCLHPDCQGEVAVAPTGQPEEEA
jgi:hypothetical protein